MSKLEPEEHTALREQGGPDKPWMKADGSIRSVSECKDLSAVASLPFLWLVRVSTPDERDRLWRAWQENDEQTVDTLVTAFHLRQP